MSELDRYVGLKDQLGSVDVPTLSLLDGAYYFSKSQTGCGGDLAFWLDGVPSVNDVWEFRSRLALEASVLNDGDNVLIVLGVKTAGILDRAMPSSGPFAKLETSDTLERRGHFHLNRHGKIPSHKDIRYASNYPMPDGCHVWSAIGLFRYFVPEDFLKYNWPPEWSEYVRRIPKWRRNQDRINSARIDYWREKGASIDFFQKGSKELEVASRRLFETEEI